MIKKRRQGLTSIILAVILVALFFIPFVRVQHPNVAKFNNFGVSAQVITFGQYSPMNFVYRMFSSGYDLRGWLFMGVISLIMILASIVLAVNGIYLLLKKNSEQTT